MKTQTLFRLGAIATILTAIGYFVGEAIYIFADAKTLFFAWFFIIVSVFQVFAYFALYAAQAKRGEIFLFIGFILSMINLLQAFMDSERRLAVRTDLVSEAQLAQALNISSFAVLQLVGYFSLVLGWILFGVGVIRTGIFPRGAGVLMILTGITLMIRDYFFPFEYIFALLSSAAYGWLGWALWNKPQDIAP